MKRFVLFFYLFLVFGSYSFAGRGKEHLRVQRELNATRVKEHIHIDGRLNEESWKIASKATDFIVYEPYNGLKASQPTEVSVIYDDYAIYIGARLYDSAPDSIYRELGQRDKSDNLRSDVFSVYISTYNDGVNYLQFTVSASAVQTDIKITSNRGDRNWNAVWKSAVSFDKNGWYVEMEIPYSALRFANTSSQVWGVNFSRLIKRKNEVSTWNFVDKSLSGFVTQSGILKGISGIKPPLRLSFIPYVSGYLDQSTDDNSYSSRINGGMDLKLGIGQSFTLDATLIPDFGQVPSDDKILNLSPFEVKYDEARQFFTEGTELFNKGDIFYSRRIGGRPKGYADAYDSLLTNEIVDQNPQESKMINATKLSGRFANGLGLGIFNAMTQNTYADILDTITGNRRRVLTQGFTNYNIFVLDQNLPNNSYVSLINTNVHRPSDNFTADVIATDFNVKNKKQEFAVRGKGAVSQRFLDSIERGYKANVVLSKISGNFQADIWTNIESKNYNPNDLGFLRSANEFSNGLSLEYKIFDPFWKFLNAEFEFDFHDSRLYSPRSFSRQSLGFGFRFMDVNNYFGRFSIHYNPRYGYDYYEPRVEGRKYKTPRVLWLQWFGSPDYRKTIAVDHRVAYWFSDMYNQKSYLVSLSPRIRFSNRLLAIYSLSYQSENNNIGYYDYDGTDVLFGSRKLVTITNTLNIQFAISPKSFFNIKARHYIRHYKYNDIYTLNLDGTLSLNNSVTDPENRNYNLFNIDMFYQWHFAPGSELVLAWKNQVEESLDNPVYNYMQNVENLWNSPKYNSFSIKILYYIDYQQLKKLRM
jgi:hypothetical protein